MATVLPADMGSNGRGRGVREGGDVEKAVDGAGAEVGAEGVRAVLVRVRQR